MRLTDAEREELRRRLRKCRDHLNTCGHDRYPLSWPTSWPGLLRICL